MTEEALKKLLKDMTLEEKIGQLMQLDASCFSDEGPMTGPAGELGISEESMVLAGSILGAAGAERIEKLRKLCMEGQPHHIPVLFMADIINGYKTIFPIPLALGCSFDEETVRTAGEVMAEEAALDGLHVTFAPMVDLVKDARWGRVMESTGESVYLNCRMAEAMVKGIQGPKENFQGHLGACTKHFAAYGLPTAGREYNTVELSERTLREEYLPSYQAAVCAGTAMMMTSFNTLDRIPVTANEKLLKEVLRGEMGFEGVLVSDWNAIGELIAHRVAENKKEAACQAFLAGVDMDMMSGCYMASLQELVEEGLVQEEKIDEAVYRILKLKNRMGLFEHPVSFKKASSGSRGLLSEESRRLAREAAAKTMVLLKNEDQFLPLKEKEEIAWIGPYIDEKNLLGAWSFFGEPKDSVTILEAVRRKNPAARWEKGCGILNPGQMIHGFRYDMENSMTEEETNEAIKAAAAFAASKAKVILALGESPLQSGEGGSRGDITIPRVQKRLLSAVYQANPNLGVIVFAGRPLDIREIREKAKSILYVWMPGTEGGNAIADILYGERMPEGKLSMSLPYCVGQTPVFHNEFWTGRHVEDGQDEGNRFQSKYQDIPNSPLYPFGYGLSYTSFAFSEVELDKEEMTQEDSLTAWVTVENTGSFSGTETVQLYITDEVASVARPVKELKGFQKVTLMPGEKKKAAFIIDEEMLKFYDRNMEYQAEKGWFTITIGPDSASGKRGRFRLR